MRVGGAEKAQKGYCTLGSLGRDKDVLSRERAFGSVSRQVLYITTWFLGYRRLLGRGRDFLGLDRVVFILFSISIGVPTGSQQ